MSDFTNLNNSLMQMTGSVLGSVASAGIGAASSKAIQKMMFEQQQQLMDKQQDINKETMAIQHNYNVEDYYRALSESTPAAMAQRYRAAGLSAAAAAQAAGDIASTPSVASVSGASGGAPSVPGIDTGFLQNLNIDVIGILRSIAALRKEKSEADVAERENETFDTRLYTLMDAQRAETSLKRQAYMQNAESWPYALRSLQYKSEADSRLPDLRDLELENTKANIRLVKQNYKLAKQRFSFLEKMNSSQLDKMSAEIRNIGKQYEVYQSQIDLNRSQSQLNNAQTELSGVVKENQQSVRKGIDLDNAIKDVQRILAENGSPESVAQRVGVLLREGKLSFQELEEGLNGTAGYIKSGYKAFEMDEHTKDFLDYMYNEGSARVAGYGLHTIGGVNELRKAFQLW